MVSSTKTSCEIPVDQIGCKQSLLITKHPGGTHLGKLTDLAISTTL